MNWFKILKAPIWDMPQVDPNAKIWATDKTELEHREYQQYIEGHPNGLWYSFGNQWADFIRRDWPFDVKDYTNKYKMIFEIEVGGNILKINTHEEAVNFTKKYNPNSYFYIGSPSHSIQSWRSNEKGNYRQGEINWALVAKDYDGIECTIIKELSFFEMFSTWDIDSGCVWNTNVVKIIREVYNIESER